MLDVWGKSPVKSLTGEEYYISFIDVTTRFLLVTFLKQKSAVLTTFKDYCTFIKTQTGNKIKHLRSDNRGEYVNEEFMAYCREHSIYIECTAPHSLHQNRIMSLSKVHISCSFRKTCQSHCGQKQSDTLHISRTGPHIEHSPKTLHHMKHSQRKSQTWMESKSLGPSVGCLTEQTLINSRASHTKRCLLDTKVTDK